MIYRKWTQDVFCPVCGKLIKDELMMKESEDSDENSCVIDCEDCQIQSVIYMNPMPEGEE